MATQPILTDLTPVGIKSALKDFFRGRPEFQDYDFEGSNLSVLLDCLAANTYINAFYASMAASEAFLDSTTKRSSAVSIAKSLGYTPKQAVSSIATVNISLQVTTNLNSSVFVSRDTVFICSAGNESYSFTPVDDFYIAPTVNGWMATNINLVEGARLSHSFEVLADVPPVFELPNRPVDFNLIDVKVYVPGSSTEYETYLRYSGLEGLSAQSKVFFVQESKDGLLQISFGNNVVGTSPVAGSQVKVSYIVSAGSKANGAKKFTCTAPGLSSYGPVVTVTQASSGGSDEESLEFIKYLAPLNYATQERCVTRLDYETIVKREFPYAESVAVWGGEDNVPALYGRVCVSVKPVGGYFLTAELKQHIVEGIIKPRSPVSIEALMFDPEYTAIVASLAVRYSRPDLATSIGELDSAVRAAVSEFSVSELGGFRKSFVYSRFLRAVSDADASIVGCSATLKLKKTFVPSFGTLKNYSWQFAAPTYSVNQADGTPILASSAFTFRGFDCYLDDDAAGAVRIYRLVNGVKTYMVRNAGIINYSTGAVSLNSFAPTASDTGQITLYITPKSMDVSSSRNLILSVDDVELSVNLIEEVA